tara:strand:- start:51 stop:686 length:636 start_codon:yes stop_codon:yes gene_type:complete
MKMEPIDSKQLEFTNKWFDINAKAIWESLLPTLKPRKVLEIGSYEGASTCFLIKLLSSYLDEFEIHSIDPWQGSKYNGRDIDMSLVESRFRKNTSYLLTNSKKNVNFVIHKSFSINALSKLIAERKSGYFDFIYIDGSHMATDVITDAVLSFELLRIGGVIGFDDYLWKLQGSNSIVTNPKFAIDSFTNIFTSRIEILRGPNHQLYIRKIN